MNAVTIRPGVSIAYQDRCFVAPWITPQTIVAVHGNTESMAILKARAPAPLGPRDLRERTAWCFRICRALAHRVSCLAMVEFDRESRDRAPPPRRVGGCCVGEFQRSALS
jgi:hypothetical protein